jgi:hypothetical protein
VWVRARFHVAVGAARKRTRNGDSRQIDEKLLVRLKYKQTKTNKQNMEGNLSVLICNNGFTCK